MATRIAKRVFKTVVFDTVEPYTMDVYMYDYKEERQSCVAEMPVLIQRAMIKVRETFRDEFVVPIRSQYWLSRMAAAWTPNPVTGHTQWGAGISRVMHFDDEKGREYPTLFYDYIRQLMAVGYDYEKSKKCSVDSFCNMTESYVREWANGVTSSGVDMAQFRDYDPATVVRRFKTYDELR